MQFCILAIKATNVVILDRYYRYYQLVLTLCFGFTPSSRTVSQPSSIIVIKLHCHPIQPIASLLKSRVQIIGFVRLCDGRVQFWTYLPNYIILSKTMKSYYKIKFVITYQYSQYNVIKIYQRLKVNVKCLQSKSFSIGTTCSFKYPYYFFHVNTYIRRTITTYDRFL